MSEPFTILGIDIGSISIAAAEIDCDKNIIQTSYRIHGGNIRECLAGVVHDLGRGVAGYISTTSSSPKIIKDAAVHDPRVSFITAGRMLHDTIGSMLIIGGEKFGLIEFDACGNYTNYRSNSSCAAGTGSFLDQQAFRLNLGSIEEFADIAYGNRGDIPPIASRCSVFAKTDLIHSQQEG